MKSVAVQMSLISRVQRRGIHSVKKGMYSSIQDEYGRTTLHYASLRGHIELVKLLLAHGADPNIQDKYGRTASFFVVTEGHINIVKLLVLYGAAM